VDSPGIRIVLAHHAINQSGDKGNIVVLRPGYDSAIVPILLDALRKNDQESFPVSQRRQAASELVHRLRLPTAAMEGEHQRAFCLCPAGWFIDKIRSGHTVHRQRFFPDTASASDLHGALGFSCAAAERVAGAESPPLSKSKAMIVFAGGAHLFVGCLLGKRPS